MGLKDCKDTIAKKRGHVMIPWTFFFFLLLLLYRLGIQLLTQPHLHVIAYLHVIVPLHVITQDFVVGQTLGVTSGSGFRS